MFLGLYYYNTDNLLCGVPQNLEKLFPPRNANQTIYFTELDCSCNTQDEVKHLKEQVDQLKQHCSNLKGQVEQLKEASKTSQLDAVNLVKQLRKEMRNLCKEMNQQNANNTKEIKFLKNEIKSLKLQEQKQMSKTKNQLKQEIVNRKEQMRKEIDGVKRELVVMKEENISVRAELDELTINNRDDNNNIDQANFVSDIVNLPHIPN